MSATAALQAAAASLGAVPPATSSSPWINLTSQLGVAPSAREGAMMAFVPESAGVILFGGLAHNRSLGDTWLFKNAHWADLTPSLSSSPPARYKGTFVNDPAEGGAILFGGDAGTSYRNDTWEWNGTAWSNLTGPGAPPAREDAAAAYDPLDGYMVLFGGELVNGSFLNDTWSFYHGTWTNRTAAVGSSPPAREAGAAVFDSSDGYVLLFGGKRNATQLIRDTWSFVGGSWTNRTALLTVQPPSRESFNMVYDSVDGYVLLYGGFHYPNSLSDEWSYVNGSWEKLNLSVTPDPREDSAMAYDPAPALPFVVLFGGRTQPAVTGVDLNDTWSYKRPISLQLSGDSPIDLSQTTNLSVLALGGYQPLTLSWSGLPSSCPGGNVTAIACVPSSSGAYPINVSAVDSGGFSDTSSTFVLVVNDRPTALIHANTSSGVTPLAVGFTSTVVGGSAPLTYAWRFGDGGTASLPYANHTYGPGVYNVTLTVTDAQGFASQPTFGPVVVSPPAQALSVSAASSVASGAIPLPVTFTAAVLGGAPPYRFNWSFGDGSSPSTQSNPEHTYATVGNYTATVTVTDSVNETNQSSVTVTADPALPLSVAISATPSAGLAPLTVNFTATGTGGIAPYRYSWQLGSAGATSTAAAPSYTYTSDGTFTVNLTLTDSVGATARKSLLLSVGPALAAQFSASAATPYCSSQVAYAVITVVATASGGSGGYDYVWSFPAGIRGPANGSASGTAVVSAGGSYLATLTVSDSVGHNVTLSHTVPTASLDCSQPATTTPAKTPWLIYGLVGVVAAVVLIEAFLILRRRKAP